MTKTERPARRRAIAIEPFDWKRLDGALALAAALHAESWFHHIPLSEDRIVDFLLHAQMEPETRFLRTAVQDGALVGAIYGHLGRYWFSDEEAAFVDFIFVDRRRRGGRSAFLLWSAWIEWARARGAAEVTQIVSTGIGQKASHSFFEKLGLEAQGGVFKARMADLATPASAL